MSVSAVAPRNGTRAPSRLAQVLSRRSGRAIVAALGSLLGGLHKYVLPGPDLDPSWQVGMSMAHEKSMRFGPDLAFTYGPLAWLDTGAVTSQSIAIWRLGFGFAATFLALYVSLLVIGKALTPVATSVLVLIGVAPLMAVTAPNEEVLMAMMGIALLVILDRAAPQNTAGASWLALASGLGVVAAVMLLTKFSAGLLALAILALIAVALLPRWRLIAAMGASYLVATALLWLLVGGDASTFPIWLSRSWIIASSYSGGMASYDVTPLLGLAFGLVGVVMCALAFRQATRGEAGTWTALLVTALYALSFYIGWKLAFVRIEPLRVSATLLMLTPLAVWALPRQWPRLPTVLAAALFPALSFCFAASVTVVFAKPWPLDAVTAWPSALKWSASGQQLEQELDAQKELLIGEFGLSDTVRAALGAGGAHVDPVAITVAWAYDLDWKPVPIFQQYSAHDARLDDVNTAALLDRTPQDVILLDTQRGAIDGRNPLWDSPQYQLTLMCSYERTATDGRWAVLKRAADRCGPPESVGTRTVSAGEAVPLPEVQADQVLVARFTPEVSAWERLVGVLLKPPAPLLVSVDGNRYKLPWGFAGLPIILSCPADATPNASAVESCPNPGSVTFETAGQVEFLTLDYDGRKPAPE